VAAITPGLEADTVPEATDVAEAQTNGLGASATQADLEQRLVEASHAGLVRFNWNRGLIEDHLRKCKFWLEEEKNGEVTICIDPPLPRDVRPWKQMSSGARPGRFALLGEGNSKMDCPTWDLPAGPPAVGGTCPSAAAGQTILPPAARVGQLDASRTHLRVIPAEVTSPIPFSETKAICAFCVTGDTRVPVRGQGLVEIADLVDVGEVEVWSGKAWRKTHAVFNGMKETVRVRTTWGHELRCTPDHDLILRDGRRRADEAHDEQALFEPADVPPFPEQAPLPRAAPIEGKRYRTAVEEHFPTEWSYDVGVFLGYIVGDGSVTKGEYPTTAIVGHHDDRGDLEQLRDLVRTWCSTTTEVRAATEMTASIAWRVKGLAEFLHDLGLDKQVDPSLRQLPAAVWTASRDGVRGFLSGLFSTDGSVLVGTDKIEVTLASVSPSLLRAVQQLLFAFGIKATICAYTTSNRWREEQGYHALYKLNVTAKADVQRFAERVGFHSVRKAARLAEALRLDPRERSLRRYPVVASAEPTGIVEPVYDLVNVGEEHQFTANCVSVSNCYAGEGSYDYTEIQAALIVRYWWTKELLSTDAGYLEWVKIMAHTISRLGIPIAGDEFSDEKLKPVRIHSSGDFFSPRYAAAWMDVANEVAKVEPRIKFWAPTRTWASPGFATAWPGILARLKQPNFVVRSSAYHVGDAAFGALIEGKPGTPGWARGTTSLNAPPGKEPNAFTQAFPEATWAGKDDPRRDHDCPVYALGPGKRSCSVAGCRVCWTRPDLRVNYTLH
jgi:hypothetical protein